MKGIRHIHLQYGKTDSFCEIPVGADPTATRTLRAGISLARAGDMSLSRRRDKPWRNRLFSALGLGEERVCGTRQVHSQRIATVEDQRSEFYASVEADGMITDRPDAVLSVTVADCLPIFLLDTASGAFGLVHSGWKGTGIAGIALRAMRDRYGTLPRNVAATIGPGIGACCYRVQEERAAFFAEKFGAATVVRSPDGSPRLDLREANIGLLQDAGVEDLTVVEECTSCTEALGSFRRQGPESYTLMLACIGRWASAAGTGGRKT